MVEILAGLLTSICRCYTTGNDWYTVQPVHCCPCQEHINCVLVCFCTKTGLQIWLYSQNLIPLKLSPASSNTFPPRLYIGSTFWNNMVMCTDVYRVPFGQWSACWKMKKDLHLLGLKNLFDWQNHLGWTYLNDFD